MRSSHLGNNKIEDVSEKSKIAHVYPNATISLTSLGKLYYDGCTVQLTKEHAIVSKGEIFSLFANRDPINRLWLTDLNIPPAESISASPSLSPHQRRLPNGQAFPT